MIKKTIFFLALIVSNLVFSQQTNFDNYQYIIVPDKFDFVKTTDQYQTSSLTKFLFKKKGFKVFLSNEKLPKALISNRCFALFAIVNDVSSLLTVKTSIEIKDCYGKIVFTSKNGKSKEKDFRKGYQESIRNAFDSMTDFIYSYNLVLVDAKKDEINEATAAVITKKVIAPIIKTPTIVITPDVKIDTKKEKTPVFSSVDALYAQPKKNGFQLVNTIPEVVFQILKTNVKDVFIIKDKNGIFYKVGKSWIAEFYKKNQLITKKYQVKF